ncbi:hypothetical protein EST38_g11460 [Candolleomyces aberdarensis]|uniref:Uncharacterized protein n=1 Tax=Candolleomyces aberdarensis TaxID=2316362 RepID=A0A4V1Q2A4_9AGAR|nr:hypothetical protein EST38_g11460 [Candolleomyces aberdarensis]
MAAHPAHQLLDTVKYYGGLALARYRKLHLFGKLFIWLVILFYICIGGAQSLLHARTQ